MGHLRLSKIWRYAKRELLSGAEGFLEAGATFATLCSAQHCAIFLLRPSSVKGNGLLARGGVAGCRTFRHRASWRDGAGSHAQVL